MQWLKFSVIPFLFFTLAESTQASRFSSVECLKSNFETKVNNQGRFFGLLKSHINVKKDKCLIQVNYQGILETVWKIDICREPIHMKVVSKKSENVYKRDGECTKSNKSDFCYFRNELILNLQDKGLIFAEGEKEKLTDSHGQIYCAYMLVKKYLDEGKLFSQYDESIHLYENEQMKSEANCEIPKTTDLSTDSQNNSQQNEQTKSETNSFKESDVSKLDPTQNKGVTPSGQDASKPRF